MTTKALHPDVDAFLKHESDFRVTALSDYLSRTNNPLTAKELLDAGRLTEDYTKSFKDYYCMKHYIMLDDTIIVYQELTATNYSVELLAQRKSAQLFSKTVIPDTNEVFANSVSDYLSQTR